MTEATPHRIERTRNRHSRAILRNDVIVIRLARNLSQWEERAHVETLLRRMRNHVARERNRTKIDPFRPLLEGDASCTLPLTDGTTIIVTLRPGKRNRIDMQPSGWSVTIGPGMHRRTLHRLLWRTLASTALPQLQNLVHEVNQKTLRVSIGAIRLRFAATQWGSCSPAGKITLNPALLFLPQDLLAYVIVHELAHRRHANHSRAFWQTVHSVIPETDTLRKELRKYRLPALS